MYSSYYSGGLCWYRFIPYSSDIANITIKINSVVNGAVEVYSEYAVNSFTYKGLLSTGDSINVTVSNYIRLILTIMQKSFDQVYLKF